MQFSHPDLIALLDGSATVVTATPFLARVILRQYADRQSELGIATWQRPDVLSLQAWLRRCWRDARYRLGASVPALLSTTQEIHVWQSVIEKDIAHSEKPLLDLPATAATARTTAAIVTAWELPFHDACWEGHEDAQAFLRWSSQMMTQCARQQWLCEADLWSHVPRWLQEIRAASKSLVFVGFQEKTPARTRLAAALEKFGWNVRELHAMPASGEVEFQAFQNQDEELDTVARWARQILEANPQARIGVLIPNLDEHAATVERTFTNVLHPSKAVSATQESAFSSHCSYSLNVRRSLLRCPLIVNALLFLELARPRISSAEASAILRSPFLDGAVEEADARARATLKLHRFGELEYSHWQLEEVIRECPVFRRRWLKAKKVLAELSPISPKAEAGVWAEWFSDLLSALGWPGARTNHIEGESIQQWKDLLSSFASLNLVAEEMTLDSALILLRQLAGRLTISRENHAAPVQILDAAEAVGLSFDHTWITGLTEENWPPLPSYQPFLPVSLLRTHKVPSALPGVYLEHARRATSQLLSSARHLVVASYAKISGDQPLAPSALLPGLLHPAAPPAKYWKGCTIYEAISSEAVEFEELVDNTGPPVAPETPVRGGSRVLTAQSACPFQAFAQIRLKATPMDEAVFGYNAAEKGSFVHAAFAEIWGELRTSDRLKAASLEDLSLLVQRAVKNAISKIRTDSPLYSHLRRIEEKRLEQVILDWLEKEKERRLTFEVVNLEEKKICSLNGLQVEVRLDRVDRLENGELVVIDYKTGVVNLNDLNERRPKSPQLLLYAETLKGQVGGLFFANVRPRELKFLGSSRTSFLEKDAPLGDDWDARLMDWHCVLEELSRQFLSGEAAVDPKSKKDTCTYCQLDPLCRVHEQNAAIVDTEVSN